MPKTSIIFKFLAILFILSSLTSGVWRYSSSAPHLGGADFAITGYDIVLLLAIPFILLDLYKNKFRIERNRVLLFFIITTPLIILIPTAQYKSYATLEAVRAVKLCAMIYVIHTALQKNENIKWIISLLFAFCSLQLLVSGLQLATNSSSFIGSESDSIYLNESTFRATGLMGHPNTLALVLSCIYGILIGIYTSGNNKNKTLKAAIIVCAITILLTLSRAGIATIIISSVIAVIFTKKISLNQKVAISAAMIVISTLLLMIFGEKISSRLSESSETNITSRINLNIIAINAFLSNPVTGAGSNNFTLFMHDHDSTGISRYFEHPVHNIPLLILSEQGIIGISFFTLLIILTFKKLSKKDEKWQGLKKGAAISLFSTMIISQVSWGMRLDVYQPLLALILSISLLTPTRNETRQTS